MKSACITSLLQVTLILWASPVRAQLYDYDSNFMIQLFHAVDPANPESFTSRGNVSVLSVNSGELITNQKALSQKDRQALIELSKNGKFYRMKAEVVGTDGIKTSFLTASKACHLIQSQLSDVVTIALDHNSAVVGVNHRSVNLDPVSDDCSTLSPAIINLLPNEYSTVMTLKAIEQAPIPDTASFIQKVEKEREARDRGETKDNRSFLSKYWMYLVPAVILLLISGVTNPESQQEGQARR